MEDHRDAYFLWKELGVRDALCLHVDAHLDISNFRVPEYDLVCPEVNCANFLLHACQEGIVGHTIWVIPNHLNGSGSFLAWAQLELQRWMYLTLDEYASLRQVESRIEGQLGGARLTICHSGNLPDLAPGRPYLLDIDIDYFLDPQDGLWQTPLELHSFLPQREAAALTVAYSVQGGYTPLRHRYLGDLTLLAENGDLAAVERLWRAVHDGGEGPSWVQAAGLLQKAAGDHEGSEWEAAASVDATYRVEPANVASMYQIRKNVERCEHWLGRIQESGSALGTLYLAGFSSFRAGDYATATTQWQKLLGDPECPAAGNTRTHVIELCGRAYFRMEKFVDASQMFHQGTLLDSQSPVLWREKARSLARAGKKEEAARAYRKSLALAPEDLASLEARLELAQVYRDLGQPALGFAECRRLRRANVPSGFRARAALLEWRLSKA